MRCKVFSASPFLAVIAGVLLVAQAVAQKPVVSIHVKGNQRIPEAAVIAVSGLHTGQSVTQAELNDAAQKLVDSGFFTSVNYRYDPVKTGYAVVLDIAEAPAQTPVLLDFPGMEQEPLWKEVLAADGMIARRIPDTEPASAYYRQAIESVVRKRDPKMEVVEKREGSLGGGETTVVFRPAHLPKVAVIQFEGNHSVASPILDAAISKAGMGAEYTDHSFRPIAELNLRPVYEERGRLTVTFPKLQMALKDPDTAMVTVGIDEGPLWMLGKVTLVGDTAPVDEMLSAAKFAYGQAANWKEIMFGIERMRPVLTRDGYLLARTTPKRVFHDSDHIVDVTLDVHKGKQFMFGEMHLIGLDAATQQSAAAMWTLASGAPMNEPYISQYVGQIVRGLHLKIRSFHSQYHFRPGTTIVDVDLKFT